nr:ABC transporter substrate-binding protein [Anaerolineae bacterium]
EPTQVWVLEMIRSRDLISREVAGRRGRGLAHLCRAVLAMVSLAIGLSGCAAGATPAARPAAAPTATPVASLHAASMAAPTSAAVPTLAPAKIVLWHAWYGERFEQLLQDVAARFHQRYPAITLEPVCPGNEADLTRKTMAAIQAGNPPDLVVASARDIAEFMEAGAVVPLDPYVDDPEIGLRQGDRADIFPGWWESAFYPEFEGKMLSLPFTKSALAMYYNLALLKKAGIDQVPKTWADLEAACRAASTGEDKGLAWHQSALTFDGFLYSRGARQLSADQSKAVFNGPEGVEALDLLVRLSQAGAAVESDGSSGDRSLFAQGKVALTFGPTSDASAYATAIEEAGTSLEWGATNIPQADPNKPRTVMNGANICILQTTEARQRAAWQFLKWFTAAEQAADWAAASGSMPGRRSAVSRLAGDGYLDENPAIKEIYETVIPYAHPEPNVRGEQEIGAIIEQAWAAALARTLTPQQALDEAVIRANEVLAK